MTLVVAIGIPSSSSSFCLSVSKLSAGLLVSTKHVWPFFFEVTFLSFPSRMCGALLKPSKRMMIGWPYLVLSLLTEKDEYS